MEKIFLRKNFTTNQKIYRENHFTYKIDPMEGSPPITKTRPCNLAFAFMQRSPSQTSKQ